MNIAKAAAHAFLLLSTIVCYQNCGSSDFGASDATTASKSTQSNSTGQPYDGKIFVTASTNCPDGTYVKSRIVLKTASTGTVVRENCQDVTKDLASGDFSLDPANPEVLSYANNVFKSEQPWTPIPVLSTWFYQLTGVVTPNGALVQDIDMFQSTATQIQNLKLAGHVVICNFSAGTFENWQPDAASFNPADLGSNVVGGPGERWLDTRSATARAVMVARLESAKNKGCDGIDLDSIDGYSNNSGFPLTSATQVDFNTYLAFAAHDRRLIVALKNAPDLVAGLVNSYDLAIAEECFQFNECAKYAPFTTLGKAVLAAEYSVVSATECNAAQTAGLSLAFFNRALDGSRYEPCP